MPQFVQGAPRGAPVRVCGEGPCVLVVRVGTLSVVAISAVGVWSLTYSVHVSGAGGVVPTLKPGRVIVVGLPWVSPDAVTTGVFTAIASSQKVEEAASVLESHAADVAVWAEERSLEISAQKSTVTLFKLQTQQAQFHPTVILNKSPLPLNRNHKILGLTFDPLFHFQNTWLT